MDRWTGRVALVTGASVGIGAAISKELVKNGMKVVGCARNEDKIRELALQLKGEKGELHAVKCDLTKDDDILSMFTWIKKELGGIDVCINNAGYTISASLIDGNPTMWRGMLDVNVVALCLCTREALKSMKERGVDDGHVIHINSILGHTVSQRSAAHFYSATKFAVRALTEGLRQELREMKSHIRVTEISPGVVETQFAYRAFEEKPEIAKAFYSSVTALQPEDIANTLVHVLATPPHVQIHDVLIRPTEQRD